MSQAPLATGIRLGRPEFNRDPFAAFAAMRSESAVHRVPLPGKRFGWFVWRYPDVAAGFHDKRLVKDPRNVVPEGTAKAPWMPRFARPLTQNLLDLDGADHQRLRAMVQGAFTPARIAALEPRIRQLSEELADAMLRRGRVDLVRDFALPIPAIVIAELLGVPVEDRHRFHRWTSALIGADTSRRSMVRAIPAVLAFMRYLRRLIELRRADPLDDLLSALIAAEEAGDRLSSDELLAMCFIILVAGHETTVNLISSGLLELLTRPELMAGLTAAPESLPTAIEELARFTAPVALATERYARETFSIDGLEIPRGSLTFLVIASANRDAEQFHEPDQLDLGRSPNRHLGFGLGVHHCLGASLARTETRIAFETLFERVPGLSLACATNDLKWRGGLVARGLQSLPAVCR